jgi:hypothetical protein
VLDGFTVTAGNANGTDVRNQGGGIHIRKDPDKCLPGGPIIRNCIVEKNWGAHHGAVNDHGLATVIENCIIRNNYSGAEGGGLQIHSGAPTIINTTIVNNVSAGEGGGAWAGTDADPTCSGPSRPVFRDCVFEGNVAPQGGGLFIDGSGPFIERCTFQNNRAIRSMSIPNSGFAAGIYNLAGADVSITDCLFTGNETELYAGALYNESSSPLIRDSRFIANQLDLQQITLAGAILNFMDSSPWIENCNFEDNTAFYGAAVLNDTNCHPTIFNCRFSGNYASNGPGALFNANGSSPWVINSMFLRNTGQNGGAMHNASNANPTVVNTLFAGNRALERGGAIGAFGAQVGLMVNCTLFGNTADGLGGGIAVDSGGTVNARNTILWNNSDSTGTSESSQARIFNGNVTFGHSCVHGWTGSLGGVGNTGANPQFVDADGADNVVGTDDDDLRLLYASPLIDAGDNSAVPDDMADMDGDGDTSEPVPLDLGGYARVVSSSVDIGAYENIDCNGNGVPDFDDIFAGTSEDCDANLLPDECDPDADGDGTPNGCDQCAGFIDALDCNDTGTPDGCDIISGASDDANADGIPDECGTAPAVTPAGSRYVSVTPVPAPQAVALHVTAPDFSCIDAYVREDGRLGDSPVYRTTLEWKSIQVRGAQIMPNMRLSVQVIFDGGIPGETAQATTFARGDAVGSFVDGAWLPPDGVVAAVDAVACLDRFRSAPSAPPIARCDFMPHVPDGILDITDIVEIIDAFRNRPNDLPGPCE